MDSRSNWANLLLNTLQPSEGAQCLSNWYWELLVELAILVSRWLRSDVVYNPQITAFLTEAQEWSKLECWMGIVWMLWLPRAGSLTEEDLGRTMQLLFRQRPGAAQKLEQWMERWSQKRGKDVPGPFQRICKQAYEAAQQDALRVPFRVHRIFSESHAGFYFILGRFHPPIKELKIPPLPDRPEATSSGNPYHIMSPNVRMV